MKFGTIPTGNARGAILAHAVKLDRATFRKGRVLSDDDIAALLAAGHKTIVGAQLEASDVPEDKAAGAIAAAIAGDNLTAGAAFTGRCNLFAKTPGILVVDVARLDRINMLDEAITVATLPPFARIEPRQMAATVKIIPFAAPAQAVDAARAIAAEAGGPVIRIAAFQARRVGLIQTRLAGIKDSVLAKTVATTRARVAALGSELAADEIVDHAEAAIQAAIVRQRDAGCDPILVMGGSAIVDRRDAIPAAIVAAKGDVIHFGMPVDPGNLLLLGRLGATDVIGLPGCARSPKLNGFDWVLERRLAGIPITRADIMRMGAGGLLMEIETRPLPRGDASPAPAAAAPRAPRIAAVVMAAGRSSRMAPANKLLTEINGSLMVQRAVDAALASQARPVVVVTGHDGGRVREALAGCKVEFVDNPDHAAGLSTSVRAGLGWLAGKEVDGAAFLLGDMPLVAPAHIDRLIAAFNPVEGRAICVPTHKGKRGNPVLWAARFFDEMRALDGDKGARGLFGTHSDMVCEVEMQDDGVLVDIDTPEALAALRQPARRASA